MSYVIARKTRSGLEFFTSSSAYDRAEWVSLSEASEYLTPDLAQTALKHLWKNGIFEAKMMEGPAPVEDEIDLDDEAGSKPEKEKMVADKQSEENPDAEKGVCPDCDCNPCECGDNESSDELDDEDAALDGLEKEPPLPVKEDTVMPKAAPLDIKTPTHDSDIPKVDKLKLGDDVRGDGVAEQPIAQAHDEKIAVPASIKSALGAAIKQFEKDAVDHDMRDDARASHAKTIVGALEELKIALEQGTVEGMKVAQIKMSSFMNAITMHIPADVVKFIVRGGAKPSLQDHFNAKWEKARNEK